MRIALDASCLATNGRGFARYVQALLQGMEAALPAGDVLLLYSDLGIRPDLLPVRFRDALRIQPPRRFHALWRRHDLVRAVRADRADLLHFPDNACAPTGTLPAVSTVHDISPVLVRHPRLVSFPMRLLFRRMLSGVRRDARLVIAVSDRDRMDLEGTWGERRPPVRAVYNGLRPPAVLPPSVPPPTPYFLFVGALEVRKNLPGLLEGFSRFKASTRCPHRLLLVGGEARGPGVIGERIRALKAGCPAREALDFVGPLGLDDPRLGTLYRNATALLLVSWYETFGFPYVEAMSYDCPVLGTTAGSGPEVIGDAGLLTDPADSDAIAAALARLATEPALREDLARKGRHRAGRFTVEAMAEGTLAAYREALA